MTPPPKSAQDEHLLPHERNATLHGERGTVICYVGGSSPYLWIGQTDGRFLDAVSVEKMQAFIAQWED